MCGRSQGEPSITHTYLGSLPPLSFAQTRASSFIFSVHHTLLTPFLLHRYEEAIEAKKQLQQQIDVAQRKVQQAQKVLTSLRVREGGGGHGVA